MNSNVIGKFISFWAFIIGVLVFGKIIGRAMGSGFMETSRSTIIVLVASAIVFIVWTVARSAASRRKAEREEQQRQMKGRGNKRR